MLSSLMGISFWEGRFYPKKANQLEISLMTHFFLEHPLQSRSLTSIVKVKEALLEGELYLIMLHNHRFREVNLLLSACANKLD